MKMETWKLYLFTVVMVIAVTAGRRIPYKDQDTVRIYKGAPHGTFVYDVPISSLVDVTKHRLFRLVQTGPDQSKFRITSNNSLCVHQYPYLSGDVSQIYQVKIEARSLDMADTLLSELRLTIKVSEKNRYQPTFNDMSDIEVYKYNQIGTLIRRITTSDKDTQPYNRETIYGIRTSRENSLPFSIDRKSGELRTTGNLEDAPPTYHLKVTAVNTGSPPLQKTASFSIIIRDIAAPRNLKLHVYNSTYSEACWEPPRNTDVRKYDLRLKKPSRITRRIVKPQNEKQECTSFQVSGRTDYTLTVRVMNGPIMGMAAVLDFAVEPGKCDRQPCREGTCIFTSDGGNCICNKNGVKVNCNNRRDDYRPGEPCPHDKDCPVAEQPQCNCQHSPNRGSCQEVCNNLKTSCANGGSPGFDYFGRIQCSCVKGYYGPKCELYNPCSTTVCKNGATCTNVTSSEYNCSCVHGYYGKNCEFLNPCMKNPCANGGNCRNISNEDYNCLCYYGHYGRNCNQYDPCFSTPCQNNGICKNVSDSTFTCKCQQGFLGNMCELYQPCNMDPCLHGGFCNSVDGHFFCECPYARFGRKCEHINLCDYLKPCGKHAVACHNMTDIDYKCICQPGWSGKNCTSYDPCFGSPCQHGGVCVEVAELTYDCECQKGHYGENCEKTNLCSSDPCKNNAICRNVSNHEYHCTCANGYYGDDCEYYNPCMSANCYNEGKCQNLSSTTYQCNCPPGYFGDLCQHFNSCYENPCQHSGECHVDRDGFYTCTCRSGYHGLNCEMFNPCLSNPCQNHAPCISNKDDTYTCNCRDHFNGLNCEHYDACHSNPCSNGRCMNLPEAGYHCACPPGKYGEQCQSMNPCSDKPCKNGGICIHYMDSKYRCNCAHGYYSNHCEKFDPCSSNPCQHHGTCNSIGEREYVCTCGLGFQGFLCEEDVPCDENLGKICYNNGKCLTLQDGSRTCKCTDGYHGYRCQGYDPCLIEDVCGNGGVCKSVDNGRFVCECHDGYFGEKCEYHSLCHEDNYCHSHATCVLKNEGPSCFCPPGYTGKRCEEDIDECISSPCKGNRVCNNVPGSYRCENPVSKSCPRDTTVEARGTYIWPQSRHGITISIECAKSPGKYASRVCHLRNEDQVEWGDPNTAECDLKIENASQAIEALKPFKKIGIFDSVHQLREAKELLNAVLKFATNRTREAVNVSEEFMTVIDNMLSASAEIIKKSAVAKRILELLDEFMSTVKWMNQKVNFERENFEIYAKQNTWIEHESGLTYSPKGNPEARIILPSEVFTKDPSNERVKFIYFKTPKMFPPAEGKPVEGTVTEVLSASVGKTQTIGLKDCIIFQLPNSMSPRHAKCVYWFDRSEFWATDGLTKMSHTGFTTSCCSSHLTFFAIAANPKSALITMKDEDFYMSLTSTGGTGCAIMAIVVVLITYTVFRHLNIQAVGQVIIQLSLSLILMNITVLIGWNRHKVHSDTLCMSMALLSHYFVLSSLMWTVVLGKCVYTTIKQNSYHGGRSFVIKHCILAYGIPLAFVSIAGGLRKHLYLEDLDTCQLSTTNRYLYCTTYLTPCFLALLFIIIATVCIIRARCCYPENHHTQEKPVLNFWQVYGSICIMLLHALSWIFKYTAGLTKKSDYTVYFGCVYFIMNGIVGLAMCLFFFILKADACKSWTRCNIGKRQFSSSAATNISCNSSTASHNNKQLPDNGRYSLVVDNSLKEDSCTKKQKVRSPVYHRQKIIHQTSTDDCTVPEGDYVGISTAETMNANGGVRVKNPYFTHYGMEEHTPRSSRV